MVVGGRDAWYVLPPHTTRCVGGTRRPFTPTSPLLFSSDYLLLSLDCTPVLSGTISCAGRLGGVALSLSSIFVYFSDWLTLNVSAFIRLFGVIWWTRPTWTLRVKMHLD